MEICIPSFFLHFSSLHCQTLCMSIFIFVFNLSLLQYLPVCFLFLSISITLSFSLFLFSIFLYYILFLAISFFNLSLSLSIHLTLPHTCSHWLTHTINFSFFIFFSFSHILSQFFSEYGLNDSCLI